LFFYIPVLFYYFFIFPYLSLFPNFEVRDKCQEYRANKQTRLNCNTALFYFYPTHVVFFFSSQPNHHRPYPRPCPPSRAENEPPLSSQLTDLNYQRRYKAINCNPPSKERLLARPQRADAERERKTPNPRSHLPPLRSQMQKAQAGGTSRVQILVLGRSWGPALRGGHALRGLCRG
jgi:hypothetical protein